MSATIETRRTSSTGRAGRGLKVAALTKPFRTTTRSLPTPGLALSGDSLPRAEFQRAFLAGAIEQVGIVRSGVPARLVEAMAHEMKVPKEWLVTTLGLARATVDRKARNDKTLSMDESSKVLGMARLVGQVQAMVEESGQVGEPRDFDAAQWVARWLERPLPALGGQKPAGLMDTGEGRGLVAQLVARMQSGAYA